MEITGGDNTQRTDGRHTVSYCGFLRIAKEILFHHFGLQVCTGKRGDITHLDNCKEFNSALVKPDEKLVMCHVRKHLLRGLRTG